MCARHGVRLLWALQDQPDTSPLPALLLSPAWLKQRSKLGQRETGQDSPAPGRYRAVLMAPGQPSHPAAQGKIQDKVPCLGF